MTMPRTHVNGQETRRKILEVALELFTEHGYDKTSLRDIAEQLGITKAALYYYFERKEDILLELHLQLHEIGRQALEEIEAVEDGPARVANWPALLERVITDMIGNRELLLLHRRNPSAIDALHHSERNRLENDDLEQRLTRILGSPAIPVAERVRMAAALGAVTEIFLESGRAFINVPPEELLVLVRPVIGEILGAPA